MKILVNRDLCQHKVSIFSGGEVHVNIDSEDFKSLLPLDTDSPVTVTVKGNILSSNDMMEALLLIDAAESLLMNTQVMEWEIELITPYLPYARQDRHCAVGDAFSLRIFGNILDMTPVKRVICADVHSKTSISEIGGLVNIPQEVCLKEALKELEIDIDKMSSDLQLGNMVFVSPDAGAVDKTNNCRKMFFPQNVTPMCTASFNKVRDTSTGEITGMSFVGSDLTGKTIMICDDICDGGRTFIEVAKVLKEKFKTPREKMILYVTHGIFSKGVEELSKYYGEIITYNNLNNITLPEGEVLPR